eukprot:g12231.t1
MLTPQEALQETWQRRFDCTEDDEKEFRPNSYLQVMGVLNLWVGCYGFNASPAFARNDPSRSLAKLPWPKWEEGGRALLN